LIIRVESAPETFRTVPFTELKGEKYEELNPSDLLTHPYIIGWADGNEGAEKLSEIAYRTPARKARLWTPDVSQMMKPVGRVAGLGGDDDGWLGIYGNGRGDERHSYTFGVLESISQSNHT